MITDNVVTATVIADASFCDRTKSAGWATWVKVDDQPALKIFGRFKKAPKDNNVAEFFAAMNGVYFAIQAGAKKILVQSDSLVTVSANRPKGLTALINEWQKLYNVVISFRHVKGHSGVQNKRSHCQRWCDKMAKKAMKEQRNEYDARKSKTNK